MVMCSVRLHTEVCSLCRAGNGARGRHWAGVRVVPRSLSILWRQPVEEVPALPTPSGQWGSRASGEERSQEARRWGPGVVSFGHVPAQASASSGRSVCGQGLGMGWPALYIVAWSVCES